MSKDKPIYKRVLLKLTGEVFASDKYDLDAESASLIAEEINSIHKLGVDIGVVVGGGNIVRGAGLAENGYFKMTRTDADEIGMIATLINARFLKSALTSLNIESRVLSAIEIKSFAEPFIYGRALKHLDKRRVVIFATGTGNPYVTTDTAAVIRANQINADALLKCTHIDGVYSDDPKKNQKATLIQTIKYTDVMSAQLKFMDLAALDMANREFKKPIHVFDILKTGNLKKVLCGSIIGSKVS
ncbi:UMP kinase [Candidatus Giovannonibacteria bacterium]|nr:UMP kinase [Candidatus Giovannonibacteria bacterium]